ncbi:MAG: hypothetical protein IJ558_02470 [Treponema sp.]|nr:hypothetical protein [Treponema sp.]
MKKRVLLLSILFAFSHILFAAPGMDGPNGSHTSPNHSPQAPRRPATPKSARRRSDTAKPSESLKRNTASAASQQIPANQDQLSQESQDSDSDIQIKSEDFINYRGTRMSFSDEDFLLQQIKTERISDNTVNIEITFNQIINPRSFSYSSIKINGESLSAQTTFAFNKKGDTVRLSIPVTTSLFTLEIKDVQAFDGSALVPIEVRGISDNSTNEDIASKS